MSKATGFLFPWRNTFRRLELERHWWHRLAVVLFFVALVPVLLCSWVIADEADSPVHSFGGDIQHWEVMSPPPDGYTIGPDVTPLTSPPDSNALGQGKIAIPLGDVNLPNADVRKTIEMPDGKTTTYLGTTSDETIKAEWRRKLNIATTKAALLGFGIAVLLTLIFSYLLQVGYRVVLYVIYGAKAGTAPGATATD